MGGSGEGSGRVRLASAVLVMGKEGPTRRGRGRLAALLWLLLLLLPPGVRGSWSAASRAPAPAPLEAATEKPRRPAGGTQRLAPGAGALG